METIIRKAENKDIQGLEKLLSEVLEHHARIRPDIFRSGETKFTPRQIEKILGNPDTPVFVAVSSDGAVLAHVFCEIHTSEEANLRPLKQLHIEDFCVEKHMRGEGLGRKLYQFVREYAGSLGCKLLTLDVWEGNDSARKFYDAAGFTVQKTRMEQKL